MRTFRLAAIAALLVGLAAAPTHAQQLLKKLESKLKTVIDSVAAETAPAPTGTPGTGYLGLVADETPTPGQGVLVQTVRRGAPSELGGLKDGDIITSIDDKPCRSLDDLDAALARSTVGTRLKMTVTRAGKLDMLTITLGKKPPTPATPADPLALAPPATPAPSPADPLLLPPATPAVPPVPAPPTPAPPANPLDLPPPPAPPATDPGATPPAIEPPSDPTLPSTTKASLGVTVVPLTDESRAIYSVPLSVRRGAVIVGMRPSGPAATAGLPLGGVIVRIDGFAVNSAEDLIGVVAGTRPGQEVEIQYYQGDKLSTKTVKLAPAASAIVAAAPGDVPPPPAPATPPDRPLLRRFENLVDPLRSIGEPRTPIGSTILDPSAIKLLFERVKSLEDANADLQTRIKLLEAKLGPTPPATNPLPTLPPIAP